MRSRITFVCLSAVLAAPFTAEAQKGKSAGRQIIAEILYIQYSAKGDALKWGGADKSVQSQLSKLQQQGTLGVAQTFRFSAVEDQKAMMQMGERKAVVTGEQFSGRGRVAMHRYENFGTLATIIGRIQEDKTIVLSLEFEKSEQAKSKKEGTPAGLLTTTARSTLKLTQGNWITAGSSETKSGANTTHTVVLVRASTK